MNKWSLGISLIALIVAIDQATKLWVQKNIQPYSANIIIDDIFRITYIKNPGGAFSTKFGGNIFYIIVAMIASIFVIIYIAKTKENKGLYFALFAILSGAIGNLIDRIRIGEVIDWIDFGVGSTRWPTFNIADSAIVIGLIVLIFTNSNDDRKKDDNYSPTSDKSDKNGQLSVLDGIESEQKPNSETHTG